MNNFNNGVIINMCFNIIIFFNVLQVNEMSKIDTIYRPRGKGKYSGTIYMESTRYEKVVKITIS